MWIASFVRTFVVKTASEAISECLIYHGGNMRRAWPLADACYARTGWAHTVPTYIIYSSGLGYCPALNLLGLKVKLTPFLHYNYACLVLLCWWFAMNFPFPSRRNHLPQTCPSLSNNSRLSWSTPSSQLLEKYMWTPIALCQQGRSYYWHTYTVACQLPPPLQGNGGE